jgi:hypothetical protein
MDSMADACSTAWNAGCAKIIIRSLPQELRDMIYKELLGLNSPSRNGIDSVRKVKHSYFAYMSLELDLRMLLSLEDCPRFLDKRFVGIEFATELSQVFYFDTKFVL